MCNAVSFFTFHVIPLYSVLSHLSCRVFIFILNDARMEMKTGNAALARSQEANYRAAIEGNASSFGAKAADAGLEGATPRNIYLIRPNP